jgi:hypothetical protein
LGWDVTTSNWSGIYSALGKYTLTDKEHFCLLGGFFPVQNRKIPGFLKFNKYYWPGRVEGAVASRIPADDGDHSLSFLTVYPSFWYLSSAKRPPLCLSL